MKVISPCLGIRSKMRLSCIMYLHKSPYLSLEALIISCFPYVPKKKENLSQGLVCGIGRKEMRQYMLDTILSEINKVEVRGRAK
jgi:hypothetical protein